MVLVFHRFCSFFSLSILRRFEQLIFCLSDKCQSCQIVLLNFGLFKSRRNLQNENYKKKNIKNRENKRLRRKMKKTNYPLYNKINIILFRDDVIRLIKRPLQETYFTFKRACMFLV